MSSDAASEFTDPASRKTPAGPFSIGRLKPEEHEEAASIIHRSLAEYYGRHLNQGERFGRDWRPFLIFPELYASLDPGCAVSASGHDGKLRGVCFYHPRETHIAIGIVATDPSVSGQGLARAMLEEALRLADAAGLPARLVSSAMNLDSFSLYTRLGFVPGQVFQDLQFPPGKLPPRGKTENIRPARAPDAAAIADFEFSLTGIRREKDYAFFLGPEGGNWHTLLRFGARGEILGVLCAIRRGGTHLIGPGVMADEATALDLLTEHLHHQADSNPVFLVPVRCAWLVSQLYAAGARNVELHLAQLRPVGGKTAAENPVTTASTSSFTREASQTLAPPPPAVVIPTFLPESG